MGALLDVYGLVEDRRAISGLGNGTTTCCGESCGSSCCGSHCGSCGGSRVVIRPFSSSPREGVGLKDEGEKEEERQGSEPREV